MTTDAALERFESLLQREREAIRSMDTSTVEALASEKELLMAELARQRPLPVPTLARFRKVVQGIRDNGVLLANARNCVRDVIGVMTSQYGTYQSQGSASKPEASRGRRLSVKG